MGRQIRFYALYKDEIQFLDFVRSIPDAYLVSKNSPTSKISNFILPWPGESPEPVFRKYYIGKGRINDLKSFLRIGSTKVYSEKKMDYVKTGEKFFYIDMEAPLVEFSSSFIRDDGRLTQGRLWVDLYRLEGKEFVYKGDDFKNLYESLVGWIRKNFKKLKGVDGYFGQEALAWYEGGGEIFE